MVHMIVFRVRIYIRSCPMSTIIINLQSLTKRWNLLDNAADLRTFSESKSEKIYKGFD